MAKLLATQLADSVNTFVRQEISVDDPRPLFLWAHYFDVHAPYVGHPKRGKEPPIPDIPEPVPPPQADQPARRVPNPEYIAGLETIGDYLRTYDRGVRSWDRSFGELVEWLTARNAFANTISIVISDHGEAFAEHGRWSHGFALYQEMLGVVWIMRSPTLRPARIDTPVSLVTSCRPSRASPSSIWATMPTEWRSSPRRPRLACWSERLIRHDETPREMRRAAVSTRRLLARWSVAHLRPAGRSARAHAAHGYARCRGVFRRLGAIPPAPPAHRVDGHARRGHAGKVARARLLNSPTPDPTTTPTSCAPSASAGRRGR